MYVHVLIHIPHQHGMQYVTTYRTTLISSEPWNYTLKVSERFVTAHEVHKPEIKPVNSNHIDVLLIWLHRFSRTAKRSLFFSWGSAPAEDSTGKPWAVSRLSPEQCGGSERNQHLCALHTHHRLIRPDWPKEWWAARPQHTCFGPFSLASC